MITNDLRWRKFSPIDRESPIFELVDGEVILLDLTLAEGGDIELTFHDGARGRTLPVATLEAAIDTGKKLLLAEVS